jgi:pimeloyl-ACP methyl ester carboxylesterase
MKRKLILVDNIYWHYREAGEGQTIVLLHASPRSGKMLEPLGELLKDSFKVIIPDLPGFGMTDALPEPISTLQEVVPFLNKFTEAIDLQNFSLYGTATGAQLGIAFANIFPEKINTLYLDNAAHFEEEEYQNIVKNYFLDLSPNLEGKHLSDLWNHVKQSLQYFPWYENLPENQFNPSLPPLEIVHESFREYIIAGKRYAELYKAAFLHERAKNIQNLKVNTLIFRWLGSILLKNIDTLLAHDLPKNVKSMDTPKPIQERYLAMKEAISVKQ